MGLSLSLSFSLVGGREALSLSLSLSLEGGRLSLSLSLSLATLQPYWTTGRESVYARFGDPCCVLQR